MAPKRTKIGSRNRSLVRGIGKYSRSKMYHKRGLWAIKAKNGSSPEAEEPPHSSYGLREKPKKTWWCKLSDSSNDSRGGKRCHQCGMEFHSSRARCAHMRSHSDRRRRSIPDKLGELKGHPVNALGFLGQYEDDVRAATVSRMKKISKMIPPSINNEENAAENLMLLSEGVRSWHKSISESVSETNEHLVTRKGFKKVESDASNSSVAEEGNHEFKKARHDVSKILAIVDYLLSTPPYFDRQCRHLHAKKCGRTSSATTRHVHLAFILAGVLQRPSTSHHLRSPRKSRQPQVLRLHRQFRESHRLHVISSAMRQQATFFNGLCFGLLGGGGDNFCTSTATLLAATPSSQQQFLHVSVRASDCSPLEGSGDQLSFSGDTCMRRFHMFLLFRLLSVNGWVPKQGVHLCFERIAAARWSMSSLYRQRFCQRGRTFFLISSVLWCIIFYFCFVCFVAAGSRRSSDVNSISSTPHAPISMHHALISDYGATRADFYVAWEVVDRMPLTT